MRKYFTHRQFMIRTLSALLLLLASLIVNFYAGSYATESASNAVTDIILSNIRVFNVSWFFIYGPMILWFFVACLCLEKPNRLPFILKSIALFILVRSLFISLTHIGQFPVRAMIDSSIMNKFTFGGDLFFSGHTGLPFLLSLIFWEKKILRYIFFMLAVLFGAVVLLAHLHYSIDVLSAFFITYGIFHMAEKLFPKDKELFVSGLSG